MAELPRGGRFKPVGNVTATFWPEKWSKDRGSFILSTKIRWGVQHIDNYHGSLRMWSSSKELTAYML